MITVTQLTVNILQQKPTSEYDIDWVGRLQTVTAVATPVCLLAGTDDVTASLFYSVPFSAVAEIVTRSFVFYHHK